MVGLRPGSVAQRSDCLQVGDSISAINGTKVHKLNPEEINQMLRANANETIQLDIEYELPTPSLCSFSGYHSIHHYSIAIAIPLLSIQFFI